MQQSHEEFIPKKNRKELILICDHIQSPANMGSLFRLSDAFGVKEIIFTGNTPFLSSGRFKSTARSTEKNVSFRESKNIIETLEQLHNDNYVSIALEITKDSIAIKNLTTSSDRIVLLVGNESGGVSQNLLDMVHHQVHIDMFGINSSMNVAQATAIAFYELTRVENDYI